MKRSLALVAATTLTTLVLGAAPATAMQLSLDDPAGDADGNGPDITRVTVRNLDRAVVAKVRFVRSVRGDVIVSVDPRRAHGVRMVSQYRPVGHTTNVVLPGAFTDRSPGSGEPPRCRGFRARWSAEEPTVTMRMPSRCLRDGDYGALRFTVLTERGSDSDVAPETASGDFASTEWVPRG